VALSTLPLTRHLPQTMATPSCVFKLYYDDGPSPSTRRYGYQGPLALEQVYTVRLLPSPSRPFPAPASSSETSESRSRSSSDHPD